MRDRTAASKGGSGNRGRKRGSQKNTAILGEWNLISDYSGRKIKSGESMITWDRFRVHHTEWEPRHPQLDIRGRDEDTSVPFSRPRKPDTFNVTDPDDL